MGEKGKKDGYVNAWGYGYDDMGLNDVAMECGVISAWGYGYHLWSSVVGNEFHRYKNIVMELVGWLVGVNER